MINTEKKLSISFSLPFYLTGFFSANPDFDKNLSAEEHFLKIIRDRKQFQFLPHTPLKIEDLKDKQMIKSTNPNNFRVIPILQDGKVVSQKRVYLPMLRGDENFIKKAMEDISKYEVFAGTNWEQDGYPSNYEDYAAISRFAWVDGELMFDFKTIYPVIDTPEALERQRKERELAEYQRLNEVNAQIREEQEVKRLAKEMVERDSERIIREQRKNQNNQGMANINQGKGVGRRGADSNLQNE